MKNIYTLFANILIILFTLPVAVNAQASPPLGRCSSFALFTPVGALADTGTLTSIMGDIGTNVGAITGYGGSKIRQGTVFNGDSVTRKAAVDVKITYNYLKALRCTDSTQAPAMGFSHVLLPGVYRQSGASSLVGNLILDAQNQVGAKFIFQINGAFTSAANSRVVLRNGAVAANVYWQVGGAASFAANAQFSGTIVAYGAVAFGDGASLQGRGLSTVGAISTYNNVINNSGTASFSSVTLPVELVDFVAQPQGNAAVSLTWNTATEKNSAAFEVERSTDGKIFTRIASIPAFGNSNTLRTYAWLDKTLSTIALQKTPLYYRLRLLDVDATVSYSPVRSVYLPINNTIRLSIYPNPVHEQFQVEIIGLEQVDPMTLLRIVDNLGRTVSIFPLLTTFTSNSNAQTISVAGLRTGFYILHCGPLAKGFVVE